MSRYCGGINSAPILAAAEHWREAALLTDGSVFSDKPLWTLAGLESLETHFIQNPDEGQDSYWEKLRHQLEVTSPAVKQLASEMNWLMLLCPSNIMAASKRQTISEVWGWSGEPVPESAKNWLDDSVLNGIGSSGAGYNNHRWRELKFCINLCLAFQTPARRSAYGATGRRVEICRVASDHSRIGSQTATAHARVPAFPRQLRTHIRRQVTERLSCWRLVALNHDSSMR